MTIPTEAGALTEYIIKTYHDKHRIDLPILLEGSRELEKTKGDTFPKELTSLLDEVFFTVESHLAKEENILFPMIRDGIRGAMLGGPISVMMSEHEALDGLLEAITSSTNDFQSDDSEIQNLYGKIVQFKDELTEHAHLEDNTLFPSVLQQ
ncbi:MAG: hemerythrin domain-containing protein [Alphaproteobacteria bacterium]